MRAERHRNGNTQGLLPNKIKLKVPKCFSFSVIFVNSQSRKQIPAQRKMVEGLCEVKLLFFVGLEEGLEGEDHKVV